MPKILLAGYFGAFKYCYFLTKGWGDGSTSVLEGPLFDFELKVNYCFAKPNFVKSSNSVFLNIIIFLIQGKLGQESLDLNLKGWKLIKLGSQGVVTRKSVTLNYAQLQAVFHGPRRAGNNCQMPGTWVCNCAEKDSLCALSFAVQCS